MEAAIADAWPDAGAPVRWLPAALLACSIHAGLLFGWRWESPVALPVSAAEKPGVEITLEAVPAPALPSPQHAASAHEVPEQPVQRAIPDDAEPDKAVPPQPAKVPQKTASRPRTLNAPAPAQPTVQSTAPVAGVAPETAPAQPHTSDAPPSPLSNPKPVYPAVARQRGHEGLVVLLVTVDERGSVAAADIETSSGYGLLDQAAARAVMTWRFHPARNAGVPAKAQVIVPIAFRLREAP